jgi:predicted secreted protein
MTEGVIGLGTILKIGDGATPEVFTAIAEVKDITGPGLTREFADFTHQQSSGGYREYKPTFKNSGDVTFKCNFLPDDETQGFATGGLLKDYEDGTLRNFQLVFPDFGATKAAFAAYVANIQPGAPIAGPLELNVTLRVTGPVAWS